MPNQIVHDYENNIDYLSEIRVFLPHILNLKNELSLAQQKFGFFIDYAQLYHTLKKQIMASGLLSMNVFNLPNNVSDLLLLAANDNYELKDYFDFYQIPLFYYLSLDWIEDIKEIFNNYNKYKYNNQLTRHKIDLFNAIYSKLKNNECSKIKELTFSAAEIQLIIKITKKYSEKNFPLQSKIFVRNFNKVIKNSYLLVIASGNLRALQNFEEFVFSLSPNLKLNYFAIEALINAALFADKEIIQYILEINKKINFKFKDKTTIIKASLLSGSTQNFQLIRENNNISQPNFIYDSKFLMYADYTGNVDNINYVLTKFENNGNYIAKYTILSHRFYGIAFNYTEEIKKNVLALISKLSLQDKEYIDFNLVFLLKLAVSGGNKTFSNFLQFLSELSNQDKSELFSFEIFRKNIENLKNIIMILCLANKIKHKKWCIQRIIKEFDFSIFSTDEVLKIVKQLLELSLKNNDYKNFIMIIEIFFFEAEQGKILIKEKEELFELILNIDIPIINDNSTKLIIADIFKNDPVSQFEFIKRLTTKRRLFNPPFVYSHNSSKNIFNVRLHILIKNFLLLNYCFNNPQVIIDIDAIRNFMMIHHIQKNLEIIYRLLLDKQSELLFQPKCQNLSEYYNIIDLMSKKEIEDMVSDLQNVEQFWKILEKINQATLILVKHEKERSNSLDIDNLVCQSKVKETNYAVRVLQDSEFIHLEGQSLCICEEISIITGESCLLQDVQTIHFCVFQCDQVNIVVTNTHKIFSKDSPAECIRYSRDHEEKKMDEIIPSDKKTEITSALLIKQFILQNKKISIPVSNIMLFLKEISASCVDINLFNYMMKIFLCKLNYNTPSEEKKKKLKELFGCLDIMSLIVSYIFVDSVLLLDKSKKVIESKSEFQERCEKIDETENNEKNNEKKLKLLYNQAKVEQVELKLYSSSKLR